MPPSLPAHVPLAIATRGDDVESVHYGSVAVVDADGRLLFAAGDPHAMTFTRSALKPLQALPFVRDGGPERFGFEPGAGRAALREPFGRGAARRRGRGHAARAPAMRRGRPRVRHRMCRGSTTCAARLPPPPPYSPLAHNCSGKHAGMLACCVMHGWPKHDYLAFDHPLQREIRAAVAAFAGVAEDALRAGIDGCSAPNYAMPLAQPRPGVREAGNGRGDDPRFGRAPARLRDAMVAHPEMVSGEGRSDLVLAQAGAGDWIAKIGAEGVQAIGVRSRGLGVAIKVADGSKRGLFPAVVAVLDQLGLLDNGRRARSGRDAGADGRATIAARRPAWSAPVVVLDRPAASRRKLAIIRVIPTYR